MSSVRKPIFVVGAGTMGEGIVQTIATSGDEVFIYDIDAEKSNLAILNIEKNLRKLVTKGKMTDGEKNLILKRISKAFSLEEALSASIVIESATENIEIKKNIIEQISAICGEETIVASNTSSLSITDIASAMVNPEKFIGMHFFNPVPIMKLLEITKGLLTSEDTLKTAISLGEQWGKIVVVSKDKTGFIVNRMLDPMLNDAIQLVDEGISIEDVNNSMKFGCNHPMGPLELADLTGIDVLLACMEELHSEFGEKYRPAPLLKKMVQAGYYGKKNGKGFYNLNIDTLGN